MLSLSGIKFLVLAFPLCSAGYFCCHGVVHVQFTFLVCFSWLLLDILLMLLLDTQTSFTLLCQLNTPA